MYWIIICSTTDKKDSQPLQCFRIVVNGQSGDFKLPWFVFSTYQTSGRLYLVDWPALLQQSAWPFKQQCISLESYATSFSYLGSLHSQPIWVSLTRHIAQDVRENFSENCQQLYGFQLFSLRATLADPKDEMLISTYTSVSCRNHHKPPHQTINLIFLKILAPK